MKDLGIQEKDIEEKFIRSQGRGGQKVNKSSTCVFVRHVPTGIEVKCQKARTQAMNRFFARRTLVEKLEQYYLGDASSRALQFEKIHKQKQKRSKRAREKTSRTTDE